MSDKRTQADVYHLEGPEIELTYRRKDGELDIKGDDHLLEQEALEAHVTAEPELGLRVTATLLASTRSGARITLTLLIPEVSWDSETPQEPETITGVAIVTSSFQGVVGGPPAVLQSYGDVRRLEGTASPAD